MDRSFVAANFEMPDAPKFQIIGNALARFEFYEILVRIAGLKYRDSGVVKTYAQAFSKLIEDHLVPYCDLTQWQYFRDGAKNPDKLWATDPNEILKANLENLKKIYARYLSSIKKQINLDDCIDMCCR